MIKEFGNIKVDTNEMVMWLGTTKIEKPYMIADLWNTMATFEFIKENYSKEGMSDAEIWGKAQEARELMNRFNEPEVTAIQMVMEGVRYGN